MKSNKDFHEYEEYHEWNEFWSWFFIVFISASLITVMMITMMVPEVPREWDFGQIGFTPSETVYSTVDPGPVVDKMIEPLPEGVPIGEDNILDVGPYEE